LPLAVLIIASEGGEGANDQLAATLSFAGQTLLEYQIRLARACGGGHIVVLVEQLPAAMIALFDRLRADGIDVDIAREPHDAADRIHPEEQVLLFSPGFVGSRSLISTLVTHVKPTLVTLPETPAHMLFERIDAADRWSGLALLNGQLIRETTATLGDWALSSTLMRSALQAGASRWQLERPEGLALISTAHQAQQVSASFVNSAGSADQAPLADVIIQPLGKFIVPYLLKWSVPTSLSAAMPLVVLGSALLVSLLGWFATAFALFGLAIVAGSAVNILLDVSLRSEGSMTFFNRAKSIAFYILLLLLGWAISQTNGDWAALLLAVWGSSILLMHRPISDSGPRWRATIESGSFIIWLSLLFSAPVTGLLLIVGYGLAGQLADRFFRR
jgi:hypothetical protein